VIQDHTKFCQIKYFSPGQMCDVQRAFSLVDCKHTPSIANLPEFLTAKISKSVLSILLFVSSFSAILLGDVIASKKQEFPKRLSTSRFSGGPGNESKQFTMFVGWPVSSA